MSQNGERNSPVAAQIIYDTRRELQRTRNQYWREGVYGELSEATHLELAEKTIEFYDVLYEFRDESIIADNEFPDISELRSCIGRTTTIPDEAPGDTNNLEGIQVPAALQIPADRIYDKSKELDDLAKQLGFAATPKEAPTNTDAKPEDLMDLLKARGQTDAIENLPDRWKSETA